MPYQGDIFLLKAKGVPQKHPCVLLGQVENQYVLLLATSVKMIDWKWQSFHSKNKKEEENIIEVFSFNHFNKNNYILNLDANDGIKNWSHIDVRELYYIDKNFLKGEIKIGSLSDSGWTRIIQFYNQIDTIFCNDLDNDLKQKISNIKQFWSRNEI